MPQPKQIPESVYLEHLIRAKANGNHFTFFRGYAWILRKLESLFLQDLINLVAIKGIVKKVVDGKVYFLCTVKLLQQSLNWDPTTQKDMLRSLKKRGFVDYKNFGIPPRRHVYIDIMSVEKALDEVESQWGVIYPQRSGETTPQRREVVYPPNKENTSYSPNNEEKGGAARPLPTPREGNNSFVDTKHSRAATQLREALHAVGKQTAGFHRNWTEAFRRLEEGHRRYDYQADLDFYCSNCSEELRVKHGLPSLSSAARFCSAAILDWIHDRRMKAIEAVHKQDESDSFSW
jgi:hypothetical protein